MSLELFLAYANTKDIKVRNTLVKLNMNLARKVAHKIKNVCGEAYEDLEQEAAIGLVRSVEHFNPTLGVAFSSFAVPYIHGKLLQYLRDKGHLIRLTQAIQTLNNRGKKAAATLSQQLGRTPTLKEVAEFLGCSAEEYREAYEANKLSKNYEPIDLDSEELLMIEAPEHSGYEAATIDIDWNFLTQRELATLDKRSDKRRQLWRQLALNESRIPTNPQSKSNVGGCNEIAPAQHST